MLVAGEEGSIEIIVLEATCACAGEAMIKANAKNSIAVAMNDERRINFFMIIVKEAL